MSKDTITQLAIFIENRTGRLAEICRTLGENGINIFGFSVADTEGYGIFRLICKRPQIVHQVLKDVGFTVRESEVLCLRVPHRPGGLADALSLFSKAEINVEYMYAIADTLIIFNLDNITKAVEIAQREGIEIVRQDDFPLQNF
ncbi:MAG TPA: ACT domain-containing protein [Candidatus Sumerlaeota bacterium]|nr:ACT domain-containing protein [Candidatus Sumerlaeota bacterium]